MEPERLQRLNAVADIAVRLEAETRLPAKILIAQWALESQWGAKPAGQANYFGIKKADRHAQCCTVTTHEVVNGRTITVDLEFADYASLEESCRDYAWLITHGEPYSEAWLRYRRTGELGGLILEVAQKYATNPQYWALARAIANQDNVAQAIERAKGETE